MNDYFQKMLAALTSIDPETTLESANSIWIRDDFQPLPSFVEVNKEKYDAQVRYEDFSDPATPGLINAWCADKTHGMIDKILENVSGEAIMYLLNAVYFKGLWTVPFEKEQTTDETFANENGTTPLVPVMQQEIELNYARHELFEAVEAPFGNEAFSAVFVLPSEGVAPASLIESLDATVWNDCIAKLSSQTIQLGIPRLELAYEIVLSDALKKLGMLSMFGGEGTDFTGIHPTAPLTVSEVRQKTSLKINEEGSEASAVTIVGIDGLAGLTPSPIPFILNRPFLLFIKEKSTGAILFEGLVREL
jgi:serpin B